MIAVCIGAAFCLAGLAAPVAANAICEQHRREADAAKLEARLAQGRADEAHVALVLSRVNAWHAHQERETTPIHDAVAFARIVRDIDLDVDWLEGER